MDDGRNHQVQWEERGKKRGRQKQNENSEKDNQGGSLKERYNHDEGRREERQS